MTFIVVVTVCVSKMHSYSLSPNTRTFKKKKKRKKERFVAATISAFFVPFVAIVTSLLTRKFPSVKHPSKRSKEAERETLVEKKKLNPKQTEGRRKESNALVGVGGVAVCWSSLPRR